MLINVLINIVGALEYHLVKYQCIAPTLNPLKKSVLDHFGTNCTSMEPSAVKMEHDKTSTAELHHYFQYYSWFLRLWIN